MNRSLKSWGNVVWMRTKQHALLAWAQAALKVLEVLEVLKMLEVLAALEVLATLEVLEVLDALH
jgi:hypothetical protein